MDEETRKTLAKACNKVAIKKILAEILADGTVAQLEGWPRLQLLLEVDELIHPWAERVRKARASK